MGRFQVKVKTTPYRHGNTRRVRAQATEDSCFQVGVTPSCIMDSLPSEIVEHILCDAATSIDACSPRWLATTPLTLGQVCYRWRQIVYSPMFQQPWSFVPVILHHNQTRVVEQGYFISEWIARCNPEDPLDIFVTTPADNPVRPWACGADAAPPFQRLRVEGGRWKHVYIQSPPEVHCDDCINEVVTRMFTFDASLGSLPPFSRLEHLSIHGNLEDFKITILMQLPALVELTLAAADREDPPGWFDSEGLEDFQTTSLRRLTVKNFIVHCAAVLLILAPNVENVTLTNTAGQTSFIADGFPMDALSKLKVLTIIRHTPTIQLIRNRKDFANILELITHSSLPCLEELWINDTTKDKSVQKRLPNLLSRVSLTLKQFAMPIHADFDTNSLQRVLKALSKARRLDRLRLCNAETRAGLVQNVDATIGHLVDGLKKQRGSADLFSRLGILEYYTPSLDSSTFDSITGLARDICQLRISAGESTYPFLQLHLPLAARESYEQRVTEGQSKQGLDVLFDLERA